MINKLKLDKMPRRLNPNVQDFRCCKNFKKHSQIVEFKNAFKEIGIKLRARAVLQHFVEVSEFENKDHLN